MHHALAIPIYPKGMSDAMCFKIKDDANVFFIKRNYVIGLNGSSKIYDYAVNRFELFKRSVNILVHT